MGIPVPSTDSIFGVTSDFCLFGIGIYIRVNVNIDIGVCFGIRVYFDIRIALFTILCIRIFHREVIRTCCILGVFFRTRVFIVVLRNDDTSCHQNAQDEDCLSNLFVCRVEGGF